MAASIFGSVFSDIENLRHGITDAVSAIRSFGFGVGFCSDRQPEWTRAVSVPPKMVLRILFSLVLCMFVCHAEVRAGRYKGRSAWVIDRPHMRVTILEGGGHVAEIVLKDAGGLNPLWTPSRPTIEPDQYVPSKHEEFYGGGPGARLSSGQMGHNLCFPYWGNPSEAEYKAGMSYHGEAGITRWKRLEDVNGALTVTAAFPESCTRFTRTVRLGGQVVWFDEVAENESAWDRPGGWCEHVTLGPPFLEYETTSFDAPLTRGEAYGKEFSWPLGTDPQGTVDLRHVRRQPTRLVNHFLVDPGREWGFFAAFNPRSRLLFGYVFRRAEFPWLNVWEANNDKLLARGMEFSNTPVHGTAKALMKTQQLFGSPAFEWLDAKSKLAKRYCAFSVLVPEGFRGVADVLVHGEALTIVEKDTGKKIVVR